MPAMLPISGDVLVWRICCWACGGTFAGAFLALLVRGDAIENAKIYKYVPWVLYGSLAGIASIVYVDRSFTLFIPLMSTVGLALLSIFFTTIIALSLRPGTIQSFFQSQFLRWLGTISYGVYVYQLMLHPLFDRVTQGLCLMLRKVHMLSCCLSLR